ncbi:MAG: gamma-glutamyltransferase [Ectothiorhodospiraceae bacterium]|nr:gamma-glutamyltransferase [Ectothiorhodospiraceae bacterium]
MLTRWLAAALVLIALTGPAGAGDPRPLPPEPAVATAHPLATQAALDILEAGGNAFDAAVAATAALAVVEPYGSGIGGGGFWLLHREADDFQVMVDGRETAPGAAHRDMYLDDDGEVRSRLSLDGPLAAAIPGTPAALAHITEHYGRLSLAENLAPAIRHAREGFRVGSHYRRMARFRQDALRASPQARAIMLKEGEVPELGYVLRQPDLAGTLEQLVEHGADGFYRGEVAERLVRGMRNAGGIWTLEDLETYRLVEREPVRFQYHDMTITAASLPSAGGIALATMLQILEPFDLQAMGPAGRIHLTVEAMRRAYRDRHVYLGDPDFVHVPVERLVSREHADRLREGLRVDRATPSASLDVHGDEGEDTTHFSIIDQEGNRVAATLSINYPFGSGFIPAGTGVLLNNEMDDFASQPGKPNAYGLVGGERNAIEPGKRPLSSMTPVFIEDSERVGILGSPGGSRIITQVLLGILHFADGREPHEWVSAPRYHHQYLPDRIQHEPGAITVEIRRELVDRGHRVVPMTREYGDMQAVLWNIPENRVVAASDPRGGGLAVPYGTRDEEAAGVDNPESAQGD